MCIWHRDNETVYSNWSDLLRQCQCWQCHLLLDRLELIRDRKCKLHSCPDKKYLKWPWISIKAIGDGTIHYRPYTHIIGHCPATPRVTWPTTVSSSPTPLSDNCVLPTLEHSLSVGRAAVLETGPLPPQDHKSGTGCCPISDYVGCHTAISGGYWRHFYSDSQATAQCELFYLRRIEIFYLLIYITFY